MSGAVLLQADPRRLRWAKSSVQPSGNGCVALRLCLWET